MRNRPRRRPNRFDLALVCLAAVVSGASLLGFCGGLYWLLDLFAHFRVVYFWALLLVAVVLLGRRQPALALLPLGFCLINGATIAPYVFRPEPPPPAPLAIPLRVFHANVYFGNTHHDLLLAQIARENPDIVALAELTPAWFAAMEQLKPQYPFVVHNKVGDRFGLGIWSKRPLTAEPDAFSGNTKRCALLVHMELPTRRLTIVATHPWTPTRPALAEERDRQLTALATRVSREPGERLVIGDLNVTPWSHGFRVLEEGSGLRDTERDGGIAYTWPAPYPIRIPIDHCLVSENIQVRDRRAGTPIGSDHLPLVVDLEVK